MSPAFGHPDCKRLADLKRTGGQRDSWDFMDGWWQLGNFRSEAVNLREAERMKWERRCQNVCNPIAFYG